MTTPHAVVWIDHEEARIFRFSGEDIERVELHAATHLHHHLRRDKDRKLSDPNFYEQTAKQLADADRILVVGPGKAKLEFLRHLHAHERATEAKVVAVESIDHPTNGQLVAYARQYFKHSDRMTG
jgi:stalled ribosome rescue protein Dom34